MEETIIREFFEHNGFLTRRLLRKPKRGRSASVYKEVVMLIAPSLSTSQAAQELPFYLFSGDLTKAGEAIVVWKGWSEARFVAGTPRASSELFRFVRKEAPQQLLQTFELEGLPLNDHRRHILILPAFPIQEPFRSQFSELLRGYGVDCVLSFRAILQYLIENMNTTSPSESYELFSLLSLLKTYELLKSPQLELFKTNEHND